MNCAQSRGVVVHLTEPEQNLAGWLQYLVQTGGLGQPLAVEVDGASVMLSSLGVEPVAVNEVAVRIEGAEEASWGESLSRCRPEPSPSS